MKKNLIKIFSILIVIFLIIFLVLINKNKEEKENNTNTVVEISNKNEEYILRDSETNSVITTVQDEGLLQQYIDNPDYNPYPSGQSPEIE